jgi:P27 family predicted phage terminase small subunit
MQTTLAPQPPEDLDGEALLEWHRIIAELEQLGTLAAADRAAITHHCNVWAVIQANVKHVSRFGAVIKWSNGTPGQSPWCKTMKEMIALDSKLLDQLGLTSSNRKTKATEDQPQELIF